MRGHFYRGRHRRPTQAGRKAATIAVTGAVGFGTAQGTASAAAPDWGPIIQCESGGNATAQNRSSSASGLFQFIDSTWRAYGGTEFAARAKFATVEQQYIVANRAYADAGFTPWNASRSCWAGRVGSGSSTASPVTPRTPRAPKAAVVTSDRAADGSGTYVCDAGHLHFEACDPANLGEVVDYPRYDRTPAPAPAPSPARVEQVVVPEATGDVHTVVEGDTLSEIAAAYRLGGGWPALHERNRDVVGDNPHLIFPGQKLEL